MERRDSPMPPTKTKSPASPVTGPTLAPVPMPGRRIKQSDRAYIELKRLIQTSELKPDTHWLQPTLEKRLNLSRTPVREAALQLAKELLVEIRPRRGIYILPVPVYSLAEVFQILTLLEADAARQVADNGCPRALIAKLRALVESMRAAEARGDLKAWFGHDVEFHALIVNECTNASLKDRVRAEWDRLTRAWHSTLEYRKIMPTADADHCDLIAALEAGNGALARETYERHYAAGAEPLLKSLEEAGIEAL